MNRRSFLFGYKHTTLGLIIFGTGLGVILCTTLEAIGVGLPDRHAAAGLLIAASGLFVRRANMGQSRAA